MQNPTIEDVTELAWACVGKTMKGCPGYHISVWQRHSSTFEERNNIGPQAWPARPYWTIEYGGESFQQPFVSCRGYLLAVTLQEFRDRLEGFTPMSIDMIDNLKKLTMIVQISAYPLSWPEGWPRTETPGGSSFKTTLAGALKNVRNSLELFGKDAKKPVSNIVMSSNVTLGTIDPKDAGVAVWFTWEGAQLCIAVDRYKNVQDNLQAIHHVIEARRTELRHGGLHLIRQTFKGFRPKLLPAGKRHWKQVLGLDTQTTPIAKADIETAYRKLSVQVHPDKKGGDDREMSALNVARGEALKEL